MYFSNKFRRMLSFATGASLCLAPGSRAWAGPASEETARALAAPGPSPFWPILLAAALVAVTGLVAWRLFRRSRRSLDILSQAFARLRDGDFSARCPQTWKGERGELARAFNEMAGAAQSLADGLNEKVRERSLELDRIGARLKLQIAERRRVEEELRLSQTELREAMLRAEAASTAKSAFLAEMSHEIRTPMNAIMGMLGLAMADALSARQRERLEIIRAATGELVGIMNGALDLTKAESGKDELDERSFDPRRLLGETVGLFGEQALAKGLDCVLTVDAAAPARFFGDAGKIKRVLINLLANALRFTDEGSLVLSLRREAGEEGSGSAKSAGSAGEGGRERWIFAVRDSGPGIAPDELPAAFEAFSQAGPGKGARRGGTGLGLAISKRLALLMGGDLTAESEPGRGSVFSLTIPLSAEAGEDERLSALGRATAGKRALAAMRSAAQAAALSRELSRLGFAAAEASGDGALAGALGGGDPFDLVVLDEAFFGPTGAETGNIDALAARTAGAAILVVESRSGAQEAASALFPEAGRLSRPVRPLELLEAVWRAFIGETDGAARGDIIAAFAGRLAGARILLAEDIEVNRRVAQEILRLAGVEVRVAADGREAARAAGRERFDAVLMDLLMPGMDGFEAAVAIRALPGGKDVPILAMTANAGEKDRKRCLEAGMNDFIPKPVDWRSLIGTLERWIGGGGKAKRPEAAAPSREAGTRAASSRAVGQPVDFEEGLARLGGDRNIQDRILGVFTATFAGRIEMAALDLKNGDAEAARVKLHSLAGAAGNISANALRFACKNLESRILQGCGEDCRDLLDEAEALLEATLAAIAVYAPAAGGDRTASG